MRYSASLCLFATVVAAAPVQSADLDRGRSLHDRQCLSCHGTNVYSRPNRYIKSLEQLKRETERWSGLANPPLKKKEIDEIARYLNQTYYHFQ